MAKTHKISVELRKGEGKGASRRLRRAGSVPAIVYGGGELAPVSIQMAHKDAYMASQNEWFYSAILDLSLNGDVQKVLLRDMQRHPFKQQILHMDFLRINENEAIRVRVPLHFMNQEISPAGKTGGSIIMHEITEVEISCLPKDLPENIQVDLIDLKVGDIIHLSSLKLPEGTELADLNLGKEHDIAVVIAKLGHVEAEPVEGTEDVAEADDKKEEGDK